MKKKWCNHIPSTRPNYHAVEKNETTLTPFNNFKKIIHGILVHVYQTND